MKKAVIVVLILIISCIGVIGCAKKDEPETSSTASGVTSDTSAPAQTAQEDKTQQEPADKSVETAVAVEAKGFIFKYKDTPVGMGLLAEPILATLGSYTNVFEAPSCAFEGIDRIYYYNGFELFTYPVKDVDYVLSVNLTDDSVETGEGVYLGMTEEDIVSVYGEPNAQEDGLYKYIKEGTSLSFIVEDGFITAITYNFIVE